MANNLTIFSPKRALLFAFDASSLVVFALITLACFPSVALAYVDPSVMTYTIQALAGVAVALSAVLGVAMRRTRKALVKFLGIDENARKEKDELMHALDNKGNPIIEPWEYELLSTQAQAGKAAQKGAKARGTRKAQTAANSPASTSASAVGSASASTSASATGATAANLSTKSPADAPSWRRRLVLSFIVVGFCGFTLGIVAPFEIVAGNSASLVVGLSDIWLPLTLLTLAGVVVFSLLLSIVRGRAFTPALVFIFCCGLCCWVQAMFLNTGLPSANGDTVNFWQDHAPMMIISAIVWALLLIAPAIISGFHRARAQGACACLALCLILVQGVGVASLALSPEANQSGSSIIEVTEDGLYEVSDKSNVVVFILDRFETAFFDDLYAQDPNLLEGFDGFTYYRDSVGVMEPTWNALPYLLTGQEPKEGETYSEYRQNRYVNSNFLQDMKQSGYSVGLYTDSLGLSYLSNDEKHEKVADNTINLHGISLSDRASNVNVPGMVKVLVKCALYRDMPWVVKKRFWFYTDEVNNKVQMQDEAATPENTRYTIDDARYYSRLQNLGLSTTDSADKGAFRLIHLTGAHTPYNIDENANFVGTDASTREQQAKGSLQIVRQYLQDLKDLGVYDNTTVIVMADHGDWESSLEMPTFAISPLFMIKQANETGSLKVSNTPVSHADFQATVLDAMGASNASSYGEAVRKITDISRQRTTYRNTHDGHFEVGIFKYMVDGYALDFNNWHYTGISWDADD